MSEEQRAWLDRYGFDELLFQNWQTSVREGWYSKKNNIIQSQLLAPEPGTIKVLPRKETPERKELVGLGAHCLAKGQFGIVILNGGMATRFGGVVKGIVKVLGEDSFLGLKLRDVAAAQEAHNTRIPVYLMNSFATDEATKEHLEQNNWFGLDPTQVTCFTQFVSLRMSTSGAILFDDDGKPLPYGPGHGDFAPALKKSGCLGSFLRRGGKVLFVCNVDNLGARISPLLIGHHLQQDKQCTVEMAPKWPGDAGGSIYLVDGRPQLVEQIRYPDDFDPDIVDVFNTNTFHFDAAALDQDFDLGWYYVEKQTDGHTAVQIERLIGELTRTLTSNFVRVKRTGSENRFFPIKTPEDLDSGAEEIAELYD